MKIMNLSAIQIQADDYEKKIAEKKDEFFQIMSSSDIDRMMTEMAVDNSLEIYELKFNMPDKPTDRMAYKYSLLYGIQQIQKSEYKSSKKADGKTTASEDSSDKKDDKEEDEDSSKKTSSSKKASTDVLEDTLGDAEGGYQPNTDIYAVPVTMTVGGKVEDLESFIDDIIKIDKRSLLVSYTWGEYKDIVRRDANGNVIKSVTDTGSASKDKDNSEEDEEIVVDTAVRKSLTVKIEIYMCDTSDIADVPSDSEANEETKEAEETAE
jgi:hypothetical protein